MQAIANNGKHAPRLPESAADLLAFGFGTVVAAWAIALYLRFRRPG